MIKKLKLILFLSILLIPKLLFGYDWPVSSTVKEITGPQATQQKITATFGEVRPKYKDPEDRDHFHNGVDIGASAGSKVYSISDGKVAIGNIGKNNEFIRVGDYTYVHININEEIIAESRRLGKHYTVVYNRVCKFEIGEKKVHTSNRKKGGMHHEKEYCGNKCKCT